MTDGSERITGLDIGRARDSLPMVAYSTYHDRGYLTLGTSNRTETACGFLGRLAGGIGSARAIGVEFVGSGGSPRYPPGLHCFGTPSPWN